MTGSLPLPVLKFARVTTADYDYGHRVIASVALVNRRRIGVETLVGPGSENEARARVVQGAVHTMWRWMGAA